MPCHVRGPLHTTTLFEGLRLWTSTQFSTIPVALIFDGRRHLLAMVLGSPTPADRGSSAQGRLQWPKSRTKSCCFPPWLYSSRGSCSQPQGCSSNRATNKRRKSPAVPAAGLFAWIVATMPMPLRPLGLEVHGDAVDAIAQMRRRGAVVEHVAEMAAAPAAMHLGAHHPIASIGRGFDRTLNRIVEARPTGAALELLLRHEQRLAASGADERAGTLLIVERAAAGRFGPVSAQHLVLFGREQTAPLLVRVGDRKALVVHGSSSARVRRFVRLRRRCDRAARSTRPRGRAGRQRARPAAPWWGRG